MNEVEYNTTVDGNKVSLYYAGWFWRVWMEGRGNIAIGNSMEEAKAAAESVLGVTLAMAQ